MGERRHSFDSRSTVEGMPKPSRSSRVGARFRRSMTSVRARVAGPFQLLSAGSGLNAPLTEAGYRTVADRVSDRDMKIFIRRTLRSLDLQVADEGALSGFTPFYSGTKSTQSFERLKAELRSVPWADAIPFVASEIM